MHEVVHEKDGARLAEGQLVTPQMLIGLMSGLGHGVPVEILPARVLVRTESLIVWWRPARQSRMFFVDHAGDPVLQELNGRLFPHPPLLFKSVGKHLWVRALPRNERPLADTKLCIAPYWNCYDNAVVCTGSMRIPQARTIAAIEQWEESFFRSEFTHAGGVRRRTRYRNGFLAMWQSLQGKDHFPCQYLVRAKQSLAQFVNDNDHTYRNELPTD